MKNFLMVLFLATLASSFISKVQAQEIIFIVNEQNAISELSDVQISNYFLKKNRQWPSGVPVKFFDQMNDKEERKTFLKDFMKRSSRDVELYWIGQKLYTGNSAPLQITSDFMMANVVARFPGAIGYVSSNFQGAPGVKKITVVRDSRE
jgi:ABC-type phosphate transport system substrate-binding protein